MNIVIVGPPGAGKGTQADRLAAWLEVPHISSGDVFRGEIRDQTPLGRKASAYIDQGRLVPDDITSSMILERLEQPDCARGVILDGYPRTLNQARMLDAALAESSSSRQIDLVLLLQVSERTVLERMVDRISCPHCGKVYNLLFNPPKVSGICDRCGHELLVRADDKIATFENRLRIYQQETTPMINYYAERGLVDTVDGEPGMQTVQQALREKIRVHA